MEHLYGCVVVFLSALPFFIVGFVCGMLHMRANYLELLRRARIETGRAMRYCETRARDERHLGFAVGYREATKWANR